MTSEFYRQKEIYLFKGRLLVNVELTEAGRVAKGENFVQLAVP